MKDEKEQARNQFLVMCRERMSNEDTIIALEMFDRALYQYEITVKEESLVPLGKTTEEMLKLYVATLSIRNLSKETIKQKVYCINSFFRLTNSSPLTADKNDVRKFIYAKMEEGKKSTTINGYRMTLKGFYDFLVSEGDVDRNIVEDVPKLKEEKRLLPPCPQINIVALRNAADENKTKSQRLLDRAIIETLYTSGMRVSELTDLKLTDIIRAEHTDGSTPVFIRNGKGKKQRYTYINDEALWYIDEYLKQRKGNSEYVFTSVLAPYNRIKKNAVESRVRTLCEKAGVENVTPHTMRRTCATKMIGVGVPIQDVQRLLGHESIETTTRYAQTTDAHVRGEHRRAFG